MSLVGFRLTDYRQIVKKQTKTYLTYKDLLEQASFERLVNPNYRLITPIGER